MKKIIPAAIVLLAFACNNPQEKQAAPPTPTIPVVEVLQQDVPIYIEQVGQIYGLKDIPIRARVDGFLEGISFEEGMPVKKGQLLYSIDKNPFLTDVAAFESKVSEAQTKMINAKNELDRYKPLAEINAVSKSDLDAAQASYDASIASVSAAKANLDAAKINLSYCDIMAPINGMIGKTEARVGEYVGKDPNPVILNTVSRIDTVRVQFSIPENMYLRLVKEYNAFKDSHTDSTVASSSPRDSSRGTVNLILGDKSEYAEPGRIDFVNSQVDPTTGSLIVQASFPNPRNILRPGLYAKVKIQEKTAKNAILVPQRCVMEVQGQFAVYVVGSDNKVEQRSVVVAERIGDYWIISEGLKKGESIVIDALQKVRGGMEVKAEATTFTSKTNTL